VIHADLFPGQRLLPGGGSLGRHRLLFRLQRHLCLRLAILITPGFRAGFDFNVTKARHLLSAYAETRPLSAAEIAALPLLARGAAMRFLLTRLYDWLNTPAGRWFAPRTRWNICASCASTGASPAPSLWPWLSDGGRTVHDGACSGNPGPGGWGLAALPGVERELSGGER
jgi:hypothetical protein